MDSRQLTVNVPGNGDAVLILPQHPTPEFLGRFERSLADTIGTLRRDLGGEAADTGEIEYQSWMRHLRRETSGAGEIEYASWLASPRARRR
jgi:hypothetical protein